MRYRDIPAAAKEAIRLASPDLYRQEELRAGATESPSVFVVVSVRHDLRAEISIDDIDAKSDAEIGHDIRMIAELLLRARQAA